VLHGFPDTADSLREIGPLLLDPQLFHRQRQAYRLVDAARGEFERGYVDVADMVTGQPWTDDLPCT